MATERINISLSKKEADTLKLLLMENLGKALVSGELAAILRDVLAEILVAEGSRGEK